MRRVRLLGAILVLCFVRTVHGGEPVSSEWTTLGVRVVPALDPSGQPWRIQLLEWREEKGELVSEEPAPALRTVELRLRSERKHVLRLLTADGDVWSTDAEPFRSTREPMSRTLEPPLMRVRGIVTLGRRPLEKAHLTFQGEAGLESITMTSKRDGLFQGFLPRLGRWHVVSRSESPRLHKEVDVEVIHSDRGAELDVEVQLIPRGIEGELVDLEGHRVLQPARIHALAVNSRQSRDVDVTNGLFRFEGLANEEHEIGAISPFEEGQRGIPLRSDKQVSVVAGGTGDPAWLTLVMRRSLPFKGRLLLTEGMTPVRGIVSSTEYRVFSGRTPTSSDGRFSLRVPEGIPDVCLLIVPAPPLAASSAFPTIVRRVSVTTEEEEIPIRSGDGTLFLDFPSTHAKRLEGRRVALVHSGCALYPTSYGGFPGAAKWVDLISHFQYTIRGVEPGPYSLCAMTSQDLVAYAGGPLSSFECVDGSLAPGGRLELRLLP